MSTPSRSARAPGSEPAWEVAYLFPPQGQWSEEEYLALDGNHLVEFSNGHIEVLPMPTTSHQLLATYLFGLLMGFVNARNLGNVLIAPLRVRVARGTFREPDVLFVAKGHSHWIREEFWTGADLVMEVVSRDKEGRRRDLVHKRRDYARARIPEYWIVDPEKERILVLKLSGKQYVLHGEFAKGETATSRLLPGFEVDVDKALAEGKRLTKKKSPRSRR